MVKLQAAGPQQQAMHQMFGSLSAQLPAFHVPAPLMPPGMRGHPHAAWPAMPGMPLPGHLPRGPPPSAYPGLHGPPMAHHGQQSGQNWQGEEWRSRQGGGQQQQQRMSPGQHPSSGRQRDDRHRAERSRERDGRDRAPREEHRKEERRRSDRDRDRDADRDRGGSREGGARQQEQAAGQQEQAAGQQEGRQQERQGGNQPQRDKRFMPNIGRSKHDAGQGQQGQQGALAESSDAGAASGAGGPRGGHKYAGRPAKRRQLMQGSGRAGTEEREAEEQLSDMVERIRREAGVGEAEEPMMSC
jgi:hypothetical protein